MSSGLEEAARGADRVGAVRYGGKRKASRLPYGQSGRRASGVVARLSLLVPLQALNEWRKGGECAVILWKRMFCCRCGQKIHLLAGYMEETSDEGGSKGVWHYHYECWYALLKEKGSKWIEPLSAETDAPPAIHL